MKLVISYLDVSCSYCKAAVGDYCRTAGTGRPRPAHAARIKITKLHRPRLEADLWNELYPVGTLVVAYPGSRPGQDGVLRNVEQVVGRTLCRAWAVGGHSAAVLVDGHTGAIALTHVDLVDTI